MSTNTITTEEDLPESYDPSTVDHIRESLNATEYSTDELYAMRDFENEREDGARTTALEAIENALDDATSGPNVGPSPMPDPTPTGSSTTETVGDASGGNTESTPDEGPTPDTGEDTPTVSPEDVADSETDADDGEYYLAVADGAGGTKAGQLGVSLPSPYDDMAPAKLRIEVPRRMGFAGVFFEEAGEYNVPYAMPNDSGVAGMRVKQLLETETNPVTLTESNPIHPNYGEDDENGE